MDATIDIRLFATLLKYRPPSPDRYTIGRQTTVKDIIEELGIPESEVKLAFINGVTVPLSQTLEPGDRLGLFPPVGGG
ncbi:MAG: MoaD/ThiS family protein [Desulfobacterales bacterium]